MVGNTKMPMNSLEFEQAQESAKIPQITQNALSGGVSLGGKHHRFFTHTTYYYDTELVDQQSNSLCVRSSGTIQDVHSFFNPLTELSHGIHKSDVRA